MSNINDYINANRAAKAANKAAKNAMNDKCKPKRILCPFCKSLSGVVMFSYNYGKGLLAYCGHCDEKFTKIAVPTNDDFLKDFKYEDIVSDDDETDNKDTEFDCTDCINTCCSCCDNNDNFIFDFIIEDVDINVDYNVDCNEDCNEEVADNEEEGTKEEYRELYIEALQSIWGLVKELDELKKFNTQCLKELNVALKELGY